MKKFLLILALVAPAIPNLANANDQVRDAAERSIQKHYQMFASVDIDRSGKISRAELFHAADNVHRSLDTNRDGYVIDLEYSQGRNGVGLFAARQAIARIDINKDNRVSQFEARAQALGALVNDNNQDGMLNFYEAMREAPPSVRRYFDFNLSGRYQH
jgi:hypothetical protein